MHSLHVLAALAAAPLVDMPLVDMLVAAPSIAEPSGALRATAPIDVALAGAPQEDAEAETPPEVTVELLADATHVVPGETFHLAVRLAIGAEHWHVYWENPGDSGLATRITVEAPEGFEVGSVLWPAPQRFEAGELVTYGYEHAAVLFVPVTAPVALDAREVELSAAARWLVCKEACFLGDGEAAITLPVGASARPANAAALEPYRRRLPRPWSELEDAHAVWRGSPRDAKLRLDLIVPGADELELFPGYSPILELTAATTRGTDADRILQTAWRARLDLAGSTDPEEDVTGATDAVEAQGAPIAARGVLRVRRAGTDRFYAVDLPLTAQPEPGR